MKKAINVGFYPAETSYEEIFSKVKAAGFQAVELNMHGEKTSDPGLYASVSDSEVLEVKKLLEKYGLECVGTVTDKLWAYNLTSDDAAMRNKGIELIKKMIDINVILGSDSVLIVPGVVNDDVTYANAYNNAMNSLKELAPYAEKNKVYLGIENVWNKFLIAPYEMQQFIDKVGSDYVTAYFDAGNVVINSYPEYWIEILNNRIKRLHVKGFNRDTGLFCYLWEGSVRWDRVMAELKKTGYDGYITAELGINGDADKDLQKISDDITKIINS
ncbi:sugar phosphate isomerase/epimerase [Eubacteriales bacterium OttesenSCG-928-G02]|nr:sugar phosphate isomerase/epimerase [Eubacteriales bacterium OttesenSCG-928-G02]